MRIISKYIIKEITPHFFISLLTFTFLLLSGTIIDITVILITKGIDYSQLLLIVSYSLPPLLVLTIPMALLLSLLVGLGRLSSDFEIIIMRNLGLSTIRLFLPLLFIALICWAASSYFMINLTPKANNSLVNLMYKILTTKATTEIKPRVFYSDFPDLTLYIDEVSREGEWKKIFVLYHIEEQKYRIILADSGYAFADDKNKRILLHLNNGSWHENPEPGKYDYAKFSAYEIPVNASSFFPSTRSHKSDREMTLAELSKEIKQRKRNNMPYNNLAVEWYKKFSIPFACLVFALVGFIFFRQQHRVNRFSGYSISIIIILIYYMLLISGERFSDKGYISPFLGAWLANIILSFILISLILFKNIKIFLRSLLPKVTKRVVVAKAEVPEKSYGARKVRVRIRIQKVSFFSLWVLDKYFLREFFRYFFLAVIAFLLIFLVVEAFDLMDDLIANNVPFIVLWRYLKFYAPNVFYLIIPLAAMTGVLVSLSILSRNNEITAIKANGISLYRICLPILAAGLLISSFEFALQEYILPSTNKKATNLRREIRGLPQVSYESSVNNWVFGEKNYLYNYAFLDSDKNIFYKFQILQFSDYTWQLKKRIFAEYASADDKLWYLHSAESYTLEDNKVLYKKKNLFRILLPEDMNYFRTEFKLPGQMSFLELYTYMMKLAKKGYDITKLRVDFYNKPSFALASLIMTLIGLPFSFMMGKKGALYGIGISLITGIFYWAFMAFSKSIGYIGILPPPLAAWMPNIFLAIIAISLLINIKT
ncbi:MAG: hypothetical protein A2Y62_07310 [Candidatus Fischerbacteria bacterium RBG_13_37_8]|uniref:LPS export ABC transporter permease LptG n=1 Tax=Candidatus Fischerbacteria bacterium RBG_13_37_8 TaxID=1817863 RepID=A0A1F5VJ34_9BACT|nr:MAG: hypothetical protein A2Y62_07310 [Candidatus Fischerbacteria bacterium RBG_13_37_8]